MSPVLIAVGVVVGETVGAPDGVDEWDPAVLELVEFVERERELRFDHPVRIDHLTETEFREEITVGSDVVHPLDQLDADREAARLRALGLIDGDVDLLVVGDEVSVASVAALYDPVEKRILIRGNAGTPDPGLRLTLVHELVHALQDQHFDLERLDRIVDDEQYGAARALAEGDARVIEDLYYDSLLIFEQRAVDEYRDGFVRDGPLDGAAAVLDLSWSAPYVFGPALIAGLYRENGNAAIDAAFRNLPMSDEHVLDPRQFVHGPDRVRFVDVPALRADEDERARTTFGALQLYLMLSERISAHDALAATDGWGGGRAVTFADADGSECLRASLAGDTERDTSEMFEALQAWAEAGPSGAADVDRRSEQIALTACDPGTTEQFVTGASTEAFALPAVRSDFFRWYADSGEAIDVAWCVGATIVDRSTVEQLYDPQGTFYESTEFFALLDDTEAECGVTPID